MTANPAKKLPYRDFSVSPSALAHRLGIRTEVIHALADAGYLRVTTAGGKIIPNTRIGKIIRDPTGLVHWPIVRLTSIRNRIQRQGIAVTVSKLVYVCETENIPAERDPALGWVVNLKNCGKLLTALKINVHRRPMDRVSMMLWLMGMDSIDTREMPRFEVENERELIRIARLDDPMRTEQAIRFLLRWRDAETIVQAIERMQVDDVRAVDRKVAAEKLRHKAGMLAGIINDGVGRGKTRAQNRVLRRLDRRADSDSIATPEPIPSRASVKSRSNGHSAQQ